MAALDFETPAATAALEVEKRKVARAQTGRAKAEEKNAALEDDLGNLLKEVDAHKDDEEEMKHKEADGVWEAEMKQKGAERDDREGLLKIVGKKGEAYSLEMQELGMELMGRGLPAPEARAVLIIFTKASYPEAKVGIDYRIPDPMMFKRRRTYLEPLGQFMALRAVDRAKIIHVLHDATSKKGVSFFSVVAKVTVDGKTQSIPLAFKVANPPVFLCLT